MAALVSSPLQTVSLHRKGLGVSQFRSGTTIRARHSPSPRKVSRSQAVLTVAARQTVKTSYICVDCGYIYDGSAAFESLPNSYRCPVCNAPKRRFKVYESGRGKNDTKSMNARMAAMNRSKLSAAETGVDKDDKNFLLILAVGGAVLLGALYFGLSSQF